MEQETIRADLHMHGPIGLQQYWLKAQGYQRKNLLKLIVDRCLEAELDICAITSDEDKIPRGSIHDRFNWLKDNCAAELEQQGYSVGTLGENILKVSKDRTVYLVNGQTVRAQHEGRQVDHLVVGSNDVPIGNDFRETLKWIRGETNDISTARSTETEERLISTIEHGLCTAHGGIGRELIEECAGQYDAIEGHNQQLIFDGVLARLPKFREYTRELNYQSQALAESLGKHWIATSDAHRIDSAGRSYIWFDRGLLDTSNGDEFLGSLREVILTNQFDKHCEYEPLPRWANWVGKLMFGTTFKRDKE